MAGIQKLVIQPDWHSLLERALLLRIENGMPSEWRDWELQAEAYLRGRMEALCES